MALSVRESGACGGAYGPIAPFRAANSGTELPIPWHAVPDTVTAPPDSPADLPNFGSVMDFLEVRKRQDEQWYPSGVLHAETTSATWRLTVPKYFRTECVDEFPFTAQVARGTVNWKRKWLILKGIASEIPLSVSKSFDQLGDKYSFHVQV